MGLPIRQGLVRCFDGPGCKDVFDSFGYEGFAKFFAVEAVAPAGMETGRAAATGVGGGKGGEGGGGEGGGEEEGVRRCDGDDEEEKEEREEGGGAGAGCCYCCSSSCCWVGHRDGGAVCVRWQGGVGGQWGEIVRGFSLCELVQQRLY